jgi:hypothetical protein
MDSKKEKSMADIKTLKKFEAFGASLRPDQALLGRSNSGSLEARAGK